MKTSNFFSFILLISILLIHQTYADQESRSTSSCVRRCRTDIDPDFYGPCVECLQDCCRESNSPCNSWSDEEFTVACYEWKPRPSFQTEEYI